MISSATVARGAGTGRPTAAATASTPPGTAIVPSAPGRASACAAAARAAGTAARLRPHAIHELTRSDVRRTWPDSIRWPDGTGRALRGTDGSPHFVGYPRTTAHAID